MSSLKIDALLLAVLGRNRKLHSNWFPFSTLQYKYAFFCDALSEVNNIKSFNEHASLNSHFIKFHHSE